MESIINADAVENIFKDRNSLFYRALSIILSSVFFANIPLLLFLIYMAVNGFFSYDFFSEGIFGLKVFFFLTSFFILTLSLSLFGCLIFLIEKFKKNKFNIGLFLAALIINIFFFLTLILAIRSSESNDISMAVYIMAISFFLSIHTGYLLFAKPKDQLVTLIALIFIVIMMSLHFREQASKTLEWALKSYGVGGNIAVTLVPKLSEPENITGNLLLLSPQNIYIKVEGSDDISILTRSRFDVITKHSSKN